MPDLLKSTREMCGLSDGCVCLCLLEGGTRVFCLVLYAISSGEALFSLGSHRQPVCLSFRLLHAVVVSLLLKFHSPGSYQLRFWDKVCVVSVRPVFAV